MGQREILDRGTAAAGDPANLQGAQKLVGSLVLSQLRQGGLSLRTPTLTSHWLLLAWGSVSLGEAAPLNGQFLERIGLSLQLPTFPIAGGMST